MKTQWTFHMMLSMISYDEDAISYPLICLIVKSLTNTRTGEDVENWTL